MALTLTNFVILCALVATAYACTCANDEKTKADVEEFRNFLLKLPADHDYTKYPIVPGELSPLVCNCIPKERRKRKIVEMPQFQQHRQARWPKKPAPRRTSYNGRVRCAYGHRWIPVLNICVEN